MEREQILTMNENNIAEFRANGGKLASFGNAPVLLLTTTGAKSGKRRTSPMMYLADAQNPDNIYVFASFAGADINPALDGRRAQDASTRGSHTRIGISRSVFVR
jgi:F420H(2)-dependent quinone reductase